MSKQVNNLPLTVLAKGKPKPKSPNQSEVCYVFKLPLYQSQILLLY